MDFFKGCVVISYLFVNERVFRRQIEEWLLEMCLAVLGIILLRRGRFVGLFFLGAPNSYMVWKKMVLSYFMRLNADSTRSAKKVYGIV